MGNSEMAPDTELVQFLELIYGDVSGYAYIATKTPVDSTKSVKDIRWTQEFFSWPEQREEMSRYILDKTSSQEVYFAPALFSRKEATKDAVQGAKVFWCEFDGAVPTDLKGLPEPSIRVTSSKEGHEHWYWRTDKVYDPATVEKVNRGVTYLFGADSSGWDAGQVLRPIGTNNHKRKRQVSLRSVTANIVSVAQFSEVPEPPPVEEIPEIDDIPAIEDVIPKYVFSEEIWTLFKHGYPEGKRSDGLMALGYYLAEMQLPNTEIFSMLLNADERWGKFAGRTDQHKRLMEIVVRARVKYPFTVDIPSEDFVSLGFSSLLKTDVHVEWIWEGLLHRRGYMLVTGPSGVGKTQFSLDAAANLALSRPYLGREAKSNHEKIGIFSLEMGIVELKQFLLLQAETFTAEELEILEERLRFFALGEPIYLTKDSEKARIEKVIEDEGLTGLIFDSLGSVTENSLSNEENVKNLMDWNDRLRKKYDIFTWYIHHHRKPNGDNKKPNKLGDVYGSQYITARATTVMALWDIGIKDVVQAIPLKTRLTEKPQPFNMHRDKNLHFHQKVANITIVEEGLSPDESGEEEFSELPGLITPGSNITHEF